MLYVRMLLIFVGVFLNSPAFSDEQKPFLIAIDIGHTKENHGSTSARGIGEYYFNNAIAKKLLNKIKNKKGIDAFIINESGENISLIERTRISHEKKADILLSIHHDSVNPKYIDYWYYKNIKNHYSDVFSGFSIFISTKNSRTSESVDLAKIIGSKLKVNGFTPTLHHAENIKGENRDLLDKDIGMYRFDDLVVLKSSVIPAVLIECGIIVNRKEELMLSNDSFREEFTESLVDSILKYKALKLSN